MEALEVVHDPGVAIDQSWYRGKSFAAPGVLPTCVVLSASLTSSCLQQGLYRDSLPSIFLEGGGFQPSPCQYSRACKSTVKPLSCGLGWMIVPALRSRWFRGRSCI